MKRAELYMDLTNMTKLSPAQKNVMKWLGKKWRAEPSHGDVWTINGGSDRQGVTCVTRTLEALERKGLVEKDQYGCWVATVAGKELTRDKRL
jgi:hypothetical protein